MKTGWLNKCLALTAAVLTKDWEMAESLADEYQHSSSMKPLIEKYFKDTRKKAITG
jgi:hypothetical protein